VNLLLDWLLIYRLHLGIAGAAWATVIAQAASFCMSVLFFTRFSRQLSVVMLDTILRAMPKCSSFISAIGSPFAWVLYD
jgi:Na+-driven multidrug efflux pump